MVPARTMSKPTRHKCQKCGREFRVPAELKRHLNRKTPCAPILDAAAIASAPEQSGQHQCHFCGRTFTQKSHLTRHKTKACKISPGGPNGPNGMEMLFQHIQSRNAIGLEEYTARLHEIEAKLSQLMVQAKAVQDASVAARAVEDRRLAASGGGAGNAGSAEAATAPGHEGVQSASRLTINGDNARVLQMDVRVIQTVITPSQSRFGHEDVSHIGKGDVLGMLREVAPDPSSLTADSSAALVKSVCDQLITHAAMLIYSDPEHSYNITCYLPKASWTQAMTHGHDGWTLKPVSIVFPPMVRKAINLIFDKQPIAGMDFTGNASAYTTILRYIQEHESELTSGSGGAIMRPILLRNADLMQKVRHEIEQRGALPEPTIAEMADE